MKQTNETPVRSIAISGGAPMLEVTDAAVEQFKKILSEADTKDSNIRIFNSGGMLRLLWS